MGEKPEISDQWGECWWLNFISFSIYASRIADYVLITKKYSKLWQHTDKANPPVEVVGLQEWREILFSYCKHVNEQNSFSGYNHALNSELEDSKNWVWNSGM